MFAALLTSILIAQASPAPAQGDLGAQVRALEANRQDSAAIALLDAAIAKGPTAQAFALRCQIRVRLHDTAKAVDDCTQALKLDPAFAPAYENRGDAYYNDGDLKSALADYDRAVSLAPGAATYWRRCDARRRLNDWTGAQADCEKAAAAAPSSPLIRLSLARLEIHAQQYEKALADLDQALQTDSNDVNFLYWHGYAALNLKKYDVAVADFSKALAQGDTSPDTYRDRYKAYLGLGQSDRAQSDWQKAIELYRSSGQCQEANDLAILGAAEFKITKIDIEICKP